MHDLKVAKLEKIIKKGRMNYILFHGVLAWGVVTAILFLLIQHFTGVPQTLESIALSLVLFPIGGIFWGSLMWVLIKNQYNKVRTTTL